MLLSGSNNKKTSELTIIQVSYLESYTFHRRYKVVSSRLSRGLDLNLLGLDYFGYMYPDTVLHGVLLKNYRTFGGRLNHACVHDYYMIVLVLHGYFFLKIYTFKKRI